MIKWIKISSIIILVYFCLQILSAKDDESTPNLDKAQSLFKESLKKPDSEKKNALKDTRKELDKVLKDTESEKDKYKDLRAKAEKIYIDTYFQECDFNKVVELSDNYEKNHKDDWNNLAPVMNLKGTALRRQFKRSESHKVFEKIRLNIPDDKAVGEMREIKAEAFYDLALWYRDQGDRLNEKYTYEQLVKKYPYTSKGRLVKTLLDKKNKK